MTKKKLFLALLAIIVIASGGVGYALYRHNNAVHQTNHYAVQGNATQKGVTNKTNSVNPSTSETMPQGDSVSITPAPVPANGAAYPIVNQDYKIDQVNNTTYNITLYAIINSPSQYDEYIAQLKQYKQEALSYLNSRYTSGVVATFTINWDPPAAKNL